MEGTFRSTESGVEVEVRTKLYWLCWLFLPPVYVFCGVFIAEPELATIGLILGLVVTFALLVVAWIETLCFRELLRAAGLMRKPKR